MAIIPIDQQNDPAGWHALRAKHIGASDVAALFNAGSSYTPTLNELYHIRRGNLASDRGGGLLASLGKALEPFIAYVISESYQWRTEACNAYHEHPEHKILGCTLDYFVVESEHGPGILEIKNVQQFSPGWTNVRAPDHVELQLQHQFLVTNAARIEAGLKPFTWGAIGSMHAGNPEDMRIMLRKPDLKVHAHIIDRANRFAADVEAMREPPLLGSDEYSHIAELFKAAVVEDSDAKDMRGDHIMDDIVARYHEAKAQEKHHGQVADELKGKMLHRLMTEQPEGGMVKRTAARTDNYAISVKQIEVNYAARPASKSVQLRFKAEPLKNLD